MWPPRGRAGKPTFSLEISAVAIWAYLLFALAAGAMLPIQFGIKAQLAAWVGGSVRAAFVSFVVGAVALLVTACGCPWVARPSGRRAVVGVDGRAPGRVLRARLDRHGAEVGRRHPRR